MTDSVATARRPRSAWSLARRVIGVALLVGAAVGAVMFTLGAWNPWDLVFLKYTFGNLPLGLLLVALAVLVGSWLALPVRSETRPHGRIGIRAIAIIVSVLALFGFGLFGTHFRFDVEEVARSADGQRRVTLVSDRDTPPERRLRIWDGSGLATREVGELGDPCGVPRVRFITNDRVELDTSYGTWVIDLDPATGEPRQVLAPRCSDPPIPATLGP